MNNTHWRAVADAEVQLHFLVVVMVWQLQMFFFFLWRSIWRIHIEFYLVIMHNNDLSVE